MFVCHENPWSPAPSATAALKEAALREIAKGRPSLTIEF